MELKGIKLKENKDDIIIGESFQFEFEDGVWKITFVGDKTTIKMIKRFGEISLKPDGHMVIKDFYFKGCFTLKGFLRHLYFKTKFKIFGIIGRAFLTKKIKGGVSESLDMTVEEIEKRDKETNEWIDNL